MEESSIVYALPHHWPEYLMEAAGLGLFMVSACVLAIILEYPASPFRQAIADPAVRRALMGIAMGLTAVAIIYSPWGKQSGAHINPAVTLTFFRLGKIEPWDAFFYVVAQFVGGLAGVLLVAVASPTLLADASVNYVVTIPGSAGRAAAFAAEFIMAFGLMFIILVASNVRRLAGATGLFAGALLSLYISLEAPVSGMSLNPARTVASALPAHLWTGLWIYFTAPILGMLLAAEAYLKLGRTRTVICAKLHHSNERRCIFRCGYRGAFSRSGLTAG